MSMERLLNGMRQQAAREAATRAVTRIGTVSSYDPDTYAVKVELQPDGTETGFMPLASAWTGNGWGLFSPPSIGDQVVVEFQEDAHEAGVATLRLFDDNHRPLAVQSGELWLVHQSGAYVKLTNDGRIAMNAAAEIDVGNVGGALHALLTDAFLSIYNGHEHSNGNGGANTGVPVVQLTGAAFTQVLKAN